MKNKDRRSGKQKEASQEVDASNGLSSEDLLEDRSLIIVSNRGPSGLVMNVDGTFQPPHGSGGLVTALLGLAHNIDINWIAARIAEEDDLAGETLHSEIQIAEDGRRINMHHVSIPEDVYDGYYNVISNPLIWFMQHSMWDYITSPTITRATWDAWEKGYIEANRMFARSLYELVKATPGRKLVMLQDYHLYLVPRMLRNLLHRTRRSEDVTLTHFVHIPWPGSEEIRMLPAGMRAAILDGLAAVDLLGFQTKKDCKNFLQSAESHLPRANVNFHYSRVWFRNHATNVQDFPISIDVAALKELAESEEVDQLRIQFEEIIQDQQLILRVDRTDPSKNIVRGFQAFGEMLELHPEHRGKAKFLAMLVPSRLDVEEYHDYHNEIMAAAGWVNSQYGTGDWEPIRVFQGENYPRAIAALQLYDVLLVNSIADGMNLVSKEGPIVNHKDGVLILSDLTGSSQQLEPGALIISPCDVYATAEAMHQALTMTSEERSLRANRLRWLVEENDINAWFKNQIKAINKMGC